MSTMLATQNPEAAAAIGDQSLPGVGVWVVFHHMPGQHRAGMLEVPALVMASDRNNGFLRLALWYAPDDIVMKDRVYRRAGSEAGWEYADDGRRADPIDAPFTDDPGLTASEELSLFKDELAETLFGEGKTKPEVPLFELMAQLDKRVSALETAAAKKPKRNAE